MAKSNTINDLLRRLRDQINNTVALRNEIYQKKDGSWDQLWAAMDALEDAQVAVERFQVAPAVSYLELYGLLQAFVVQQDSIDHIRQITIGVKCIKWKEDEPELNKVRRLRNETTGHPTRVKAGDNIVYCNIDRNSITKDRFEYILWSDKGAARRTANISETIATQNKELVRLITSAMTTVSEKEDEFLKKFTGKKVIDVYRQVSRYYFEKMYSRENNPELAQSMFNSLRKVYSEIRNMLEERYGDFSSTVNAPGLKLAIQELDELLNRIGVKLSTPGPDEFDFQVYIEVLEKKWEELGGMVDEADKRFSQK